MEKIKNLFKILLIIGCVLILIVIIDITSIFLSSKPVFAREEKYDGYNHVVYRGLFYDTYNCEHYTVPVIKSKNEKFYCDINPKKVVSIVDRSKGIKDFTCASALEGFYEDFEYRYYFSCIKGNYIIVNYFDGTTKTVKDALKSGDIKINDLENYHIDFIKEKKS